VDTVLYGQDGVEGVLLRNGEKIGSESVIVAVGGKSVPQTGSPVYTLGMKKRLFKHDF
jgi:hypothetical protein